MTTRQLSIVIGLSLLVLGGAAFFSSRISTFTACALGDSAVDAPNGWSVRGDTSVSISLPPGVSPITVRSVDSTSFAYAGKDLRLHISYGPFDGAQNDYASGPGVHRETWCIDGKRFDACTYLVERSSAATRTPSAHTRVICLNHHTGDYGVSVVVECDSTEAESTAQVALRTIRLR